MRKVQNIQVTYDDDKLGPKAWETGWSDTKGSETQVANFLQWLIDSGIYDEITVHKTFSVTKSVIKRLSG